MYANIMSLTWHLFPTTQHTSRQNRFTNSDCSYLTESHSWQKFISDKLLDKSYVTAHGATTNCATMLEKPSTSATASATMTGILIRSYLAM